MSESRPALEVVPSSAEPGPGEVANVSGNHFDKHGSGNALFRSLMTKFHADLIESVMAFAPNSVLDAGCGEGRTTAVIHEYVESVVGIELEEDALKQAESGSAGMEFVAGSVYEMPFADASFDVVVCTEVLEHLTDPGRALVELVRVARSGVVLTVPREPWWRVANMARGAHFSRMGNTPGHVQHFTKSRLASLISGHADGMSYELSGSTMWRVARLTL